MTFATTLQGTTLSHGAFVGYTWVIWVTQLEMVSAICGLVAKQGIGFALWSPGR